MADTFRQHLEASLYPVYVLDRELPRGGMSRVFLAMEVSLGREVVVKVLSPDLAAGVNRARFRREVQLAAQLQHPYIVPLLSAGEKDDILWYSMPFIQGRSLRSALAEQGRIPPAQALGWLRDITDALVYAHGRGIIHRDIKPGNVLTQGAHALLTDFGIAKAISDALPGDNMTGTGFAIGTPAYMAPEQLAADPKADHRLDIYAVGLLGYELLSGSSPFEGASPQQTLAAQLTRVPEPISHVAPAVAPAFGEVIMHCLQKHADDRPPTAAALLQELERVARDGAESAPAQAARRPSPTSRAAAPAAAPAPAAGARTAADAPRRWNVPLTLAALLVVAGIAWTAVARRGTGTTAAAPAEPVAATTAAPAAPAAPVEASPAPLTLSRADSLAIAERVRAEQHAAAPAQGPAPSAQRTDSITTAAIARAVDSVMRQRAASAPPRPDAPDPAASAGLPLDAPLPPAAPASRRVVAFLGVTNATGRAELDAAAQQATDSLGRLLQQAAGAELVPQGELRGLERFGTRGKLLVAQRLGIGAMVRGQLVQQDDGVVLQTLVTDLHRPESPVTVTTPRAPATQPLATLGASVPALRTTLDQVDWSALGGEAGTDGSPGGESRRIPRFPFRRRN